MKNGTDTDTRVTRFESSDDTAIVSARDGRRHVQHFAARRGGCLHLGEVTLTDLDTGRSKSFSVTSIADPSVSHITYLLGLWDRHLGDPEAAGASAAERLETLIAETYAPQPALETTAQGVDRWRENEWLDARIAARAAFSALAVIVLDPATRAYLETSDPKALTQAIEAANGLDVILDHEAQLR